MQEKNNSITMLIIDESGSMRRMSDFVEELYSEIIFEIKKGLSQYSDSRHYFECWSFNSCEISQRVPLTEIFNDSNVTIGYTPMGRTPLLDAIGTAINKLEKRIHVNSQLRSIHVDVCIVSDGLENHSSEYSYLDIRKMIFNCEKHGWSFSYYGTNHDVHQVGSKLAIQDISYFQPTKEGFQIISTNFKTKMRKSKSLYLNPKKGGQK